MIIALTFFITVSLILAVAVAVQQRQIIEQAKRLHVKDATVAAATQSPPASGRDPFVVVVPGNSATDADDDMWSYWERQDWSTS